MVDIDTTIVWTFKNRIANLVRSLDTAHKTCSPMVKFCLIDGGTNRSGLEHLKQWLSTNMKQRLINICESPNGTSICEGWNLGMYLAPTRYVIFASSDVVFNRVGWEEEMCARFKEGKEYILLENHAVFGFDKRVIPKMGWFDENYKSGPHFDVDFMIRASENGVKLHISHNYGFYDHADSAEETKDRLTKDCPDRLPMNDFHNEDYFKNKWRTDWPGWRESIARGIYNPLPHPPTSIAQVSRLSSETNWHPGWTEKILRLYGSN